ncbi:unnamed protein product [Protopolystoma xenopodis]|uniref:Uncharacterized protein n=1 Tax=Protopolystoma xenopodis TaxID=117903 RepID=A0A448WSZ9_9PLAT|nr:unnamed protein product [Protopolystoma xenopodis]
MRQKDGVPQDQEQNDDEDNDLLLVSAWAGISTTSLTGRVSPSKPEASDLCQARVMASSFHSTRTSLSGGGADDLNTFRDPEGDCIDASIHNSEVHLDRSGITGDGGTPDEFSTVPQSHCATRRATTSLPLSDTRRSESPARGDSSEFQTASESTHSSADRSSEPPPGNLILYSIFFYFS